MAKFKPLLAGSFPLGLELEGSDLDVLCEADCLDEFEALARGAFADRPGFEAERKSKKGVPTQLVRFILDGYPVELFAQPLAVEFQRAFRHLDLEWRLLEWGGQALKWKVMALKRAGLKTEPAFAQVLGLEGDCFQLLDQLADEENIEIWLKNQPELRL